MNTKYTRITFILLLPILTLIAAYFVGKRAFYYESGYLINRPDVLPQKPGFVTYMINIKDFNKNRNDLFRLLPHDTTDIVFIGTSLTESFPLQEMFVNGHIKNRGIGGNTSKDILDRLLIITNNKPQKIFLEMGTNDLTDLQSVDTTFSNLKKILYQLTIKTPKTRLYIQSVLPFGNEKSIKIIEAYNSKVAGFCHENHIAFINLYPAYLKKGLLNKALTIDGKHLNAKGYLAWYSLIRRYVLE